MSRLTYRQDTQQRECNTYRAYGEPDRVALLSRSE